VFHNKSGFDVVIANPPYVGQKGNKTLFESMRNDPNFEKKMDYWYFFLHRAYILNNNNGITTFITPNYWVTARGGRKLRRRILNDFKIIEWINFNDNNIFEAGVHTNIFILQKSNVTDNPIKCTVYQNVYKENILENRDSELNFISNQLDIFSTWTGYVHFLPIPILKIINKLSIECEKLSDDESQGTARKGMVAGKKITDGICNINQGIITGKDRYKDKDSQIDEGVYVLSKEEIDVLKLSEVEKQYVKPFIKNSDIKKYNLKIDSDYFILYVDEIEQPSEFTKLTSICDHLSNYRIHLNKRYINGVLQSAYRKGKWWALIHTVPISTIKNPKIICPQRSRENVFAYDSGETFASADVYYISLNKDSFSIKYILALLNSQLIYFWLYWMGKRKGETLELYFEPLQFVPIKKIPLEQQKPLIELVDKIILYKNEYPDKDTTQLVKEIDQYVYNLYSLTPEEIRIVEGENKNSN
jgi:adenine-specific DNA-methyltransferase